MCYKEKSLKPGVSQSQSFFVRYMLKNLRELLCNNLPYILSSFTPFTNKEKKKKYLNNLNYLNNLGKRPGASCNNR